MPYNPYNIPSGEYVEIPTDFSPSLVNDYYNAVLKSRQVNPRYDVFEEIMKTLMGLGQGYFGQELKSSIAQRDAQAQTERDIYKTSRVKEIEDAYGQAKEQRIREQELSDRSELGRAMEQWGRVNQPGPSTSMNLPGEPGGYTDLPGERPEPMDAMMRMAGQYPQLAGMLQGKMGAGWTGQQMDPLNSRKRLADIEAKLAGAEASRGRAGLYGAQTGQTGARTDLTRAQTEGEQLENWFKQQAMDAIKMGKHDEARLYIAMAENKPWESSEEKAYGKTKGEIEAKKEGGIPYYSPRASAQPKTPKYDYRQDYVDLKSKIDRGIATDEDKIRFEAVKVLVEKQDVIIQMMKMWDQRRGQGGSSNPNFKQP